MCLHFRRLWVNGGVASLLSLNMVLCVKGVHTLSGRRQADRWHRWKTSSGVGFKEHGLCSAKKRVQSQVSDEVHQSVPQQTGTICN